MKQRYVGEFSLVIV